MLNNNSDEQINAIEEVETKLLLEGIYQHYGYDFRNYSYSSINRRIKHRVNVEEVNTISELQAKVLYDPKVMNRLLGDFSINVTEMFRDPSFFKLFRDLVIPKLAKLPVIRIWHAGCSTGEEVYSMAILLYETGLYKRARIYATDMNEDILEKASLGKIPLDYMQKYTKNYQQAGGEKEFSEYYTVHHDHVAIRSMLKENLVFAHHNLVTDHSFNEFHVILCRNVLIYFNNQLKTRVYQLFNQSLSENGIICFGNKETITDHTALSFFNELDSSEKIYVKTTKEKTKT
ncbi:CheR family methyltransferase [Evansella cellulosilytica]|uniref:MCP methyltransferase, CheR-type n=1 Tax=Evansella cellulosilytica (strain ATCC 21833 / DSM 2522 / FERM P-1141 / JCM 9156 / N-4) TaxID=649639 RepID=E6U275_EVAC2|nr:protein-glutamate O-methyltransferase CheR [Evansella cellulosilytica]ADU30453.1 MCP methyltransferase, CheR-type [Evansella cellulosilytica DSM 2522]